MSKLSFRARPLEVSKPMSIFMSEELPDLPEYSAINRAVPQMPSGMKKEEESEHHLQRAIVTGLIIPTPEVIHIGDVAAYNRLYAPNYKVPRQLIHMQPFTMEQDIPDYDMDSEDEKWLAVHSKTMDIDALKFEEMMDRLEKNSGHSVVTQMEAKVLLKEDDDLIIAVYDYWLNKRLRTQQSLIPCVKTEGHRGGMNNNNPYLAFRRRTEKMQTRKNRKNDESTYEKMVKLKRDLSRALTLLELIKRRENSKREFLHLTVEIFEKRHQAQDYSGQLLAELSALKTFRPAFAPLFTNQYNHGTSWPKPIKDDYMPRKEKRQYKKRKHKSISTSLFMNDMVGIVSSGDDDGHNVSSTSPTTEDTPFTFRRKRQCLYHAPLSTGLGNWPWCGWEDGGLADQRFRFSLASIATPITRCVGLTRRRVGRGGRVILDRAGPPMDDFWSTLDFTIHDNSKEKSLMFDVKPVIDDKLLYEVDKKPIIDKKFDKLLYEVDIKPIIDKKFVINDKSLQVPDSFDYLAHFRPKSPIKTEPEEEETHVLNNSALALAIEDINESTSDSTPVSLNLSDLFPSLAWEIPDPEVVVKTEPPESQPDIGTITPPNETETELDELFKVTEPVTPETLTKSIEKSIETELEVSTKNFKQAFIGKKDYKSGSLLDRWARFENPPPEPVKKQKSSTPEPFFLEDLTGCSTFRTSNCWPEPKEHSPSDKTETLPVNKPEEPKEPASVIEEPPHLPPTPPKEPKTPPPVTDVHRPNNLAAHTNGPVNLDLKKSRHLSKHIGSNSSYRRKNNHSHHSHGLNNKLLMRLPENRGDILETAVVNNQIIADKNPNDLLMRKSTQVPMEVT